MNRNVLMLCAFALCAMQALAGPVRPPFVQEFDSAGLPEDAYLSFSSTGTGRMRITQGDLTTHPANGGATNSSTGANRFRGTVFHVTGERYLYSHDFYLDRPSAMEVTFLVYGAAAEGGPYTRMHQITRQVEAGAGYVSSGAMNLNLTPGYYLIGAAWPEPATHDFRGLTYPVASPLGQIRGGYINNTGTPPGTLPGVTLNGTAYRQRFRSGSTPEISEVPTAGANTAATLSNIFRGNIYEVTRDTQLRSHSLRVHLAAPTSVTFSVYESDTRDGEYTRIDSLTATFDPIDGWIGVDSNVQMKAGRFYLLGAYWLSGTTYYYRSSFFSSPQTLPFGRAVEGKQFSGPPPVTFVNNTPTVLTAYQQRLETEEMHALRMDSSASSSLSINRADFQVDLSHFTNATLRFSHRAQGEQAHEEGVYLSTDGNIWHKVLDLPNGSTEQEDFELNLVQAAQNLFLPLNADLRIRFQQQDDGSWPTRGREFRRIRVDSPPDLRLTTFQPFPAVHFFRGTNVAKTFNFQAAYERRGGSEDTTLPSHVIRATVQVGATPFSQDSTRLVGNLPAYSVSPDSAALAVTVPDTTMMPNLVYPVSFTLDANSHLSPQASGSNHHFSNFVGVNHYAGTLFFGSAPAEIWIESMTIRDPVEMDTAHNITGHGIIQGRAFAFSNLQVTKNLSTLDYTVLPAETQVIEVAGIAANILNGVRNQSVGPIRLTSAGPRADIRVTFPAGFGWAASPTLNAASPRIDFDNTPLNPTLGLPAALLALGSRWCVLDTLPLWFEVGAIAWGPASGNFVLNVTGDTVYVREAKLEALENAQSLGWITPGMALRRNNAGYHRGVSAVPGNRTLFTGPDGVAQLDAAFDIAPGSLRTHAPYDVEIAWNDPGTLLLEKSIPAAGSGLEGVAALMLNYARGCPDNCPGNDLEGSLVLIPSGGSLSITRDGGLHSPVAVPGEPAVEWGFDAAIPAHAMRINKVDNGVFLAAGYFLPGADAGNLALENRPAGVLLSGMGWDNPYKADRPWSQTYLEGTGAYAGFNFRIPDLASPAAQSVVGGTPFGPFDLESSSKFYTRASGVTGIFNAGLTNMSGSIYGYPFSFSQFAFSYLSNENVASRTDGQLTLPYPVNDILKFRRMRLNCKGGLESAEPLPGSNELALEYWAADFHFSQIDFRREAGCNPDPANLVLRGRSEAAHVPEPLFAELGFWPDGNLITAADARLGITSRFSLPAAFTIAGSDGEDYTFIAATQPYLNHYAASAGNQSPGQGYFSLAGKINVPFFGEVPSQLQTLAGTDPNLPLFVAGGWPDKGWSVGSDNFFTNPSFDSGNIGWPSGSISLAEYRTGADVNFRPRVKRDWTAGVEFDFDLRWGPGTKAFRSPDFVAKPILVLPIDHEIKYLSARRAEISFGVAYDGLPSLNLGGLAFDALDRFGLPVPGAATAVFSAGLQPLTAAIDAGFASLDRILSPTSIDLLEPVYANLIDPVIEELYSQLLVIDWQGGEAAISASVSAALDRVIRGQINGGAVPLWNARDGFQFFFEGFNGNPGLLDRLIVELDRAILSLDAVNVGNQINVNPDEAAVLANGLLHRAGNGRYTHLEDLTLAFFQLYFSNLGSPITVPPEIVSTVQAMIDGAIPGLTALSESLSAVREDLLLLRESLSVGGQFRAELNAILNLPEIDLMLGRVKLKIEERLRLQLFDWPGGRLAITDLTGEEFKALLRRELIAEFEGSVFLRGLSSSLRARLFGLDLSFRISADGLFQLINGFVRELAASAFAVVDDTINGFLGDLNDKIGAGRLDGYAHIRGDTLERLSIDAYLRMNITSPVEFSGGILIENLQAPPLRVNEVLSARGPRISIGALDVPLNWLGGGVDASIATRIGLRAELPPFPVNLGGSFSFEDEIGVDFQGMTLLRLSSTLAFGLDENYIGGAGRARFDKIELGAGFFMGRSLTLDPLLVIDGDVATIVGAGPFTGGYLFGEAWMPLIDYGCAFNVGASVGAGFFFFAEGPTYGLKMTLGAFGEALCLLTIRGQVSMTGGRSNGQNRAVGRGVLSGTVGPCRFCTRWSKQVNLVYDDGSWDVSY